LTKKNATYTYSKVTYQVPVQNIYGIAHSTAVYQIRIWIRSDPELFAGFGSAIQITDLNPDLERIRNTNLEEKLIFLLNKMIIYVLNISFPISKYLNTLDPDLEFPSKSNPDPEIIFSDTTHCSTAPIPQE